MAGAIKGITVEIGGDTTKLSKALNDVNKESKSLQSELRGINSLLKMDPSSTELLSQKQQVLAQSISTSKEKLESLKSVQDQVAQQYANGDIGEEEYRDFQREIVATEQKVKSLEEQMKEFGSVSAQQIAQAGEKVKDIGGKIESAGKAFAPVSAAAAGLGAASVAAFKDLDSGYDTIVKTTGATGESLEGLKKSANNVFGSLPEDMDNVGGAIGEVNTRFGYTDEKLETTTSSFLKFAKITGQDVVTSIGNTDKIMEAWNISAEDTDKLLGLIAGKAQETGISVDTLESSVMQNSATFKEMGLGLEQSIGLMAQFEKSGVDSSTAIAALKKTVVNATKDGKTAEQALNDTIISIKNASSETEALSIASETFGNKGAAEMVYAIKEGRFSLDDLNVSMGDYANTVSDTYEATIDPMDKLNIAFNNLKITGAELGASILETVQPMFDKLVDGAKKLAEWFGGLSDGTKKIIVVVLGVTAAIAPLLMIIGKLTTAVGSIMTMAPKIQGAFTAITGLVGGLSAPVLIAVAAIAALVAVFVNLWNTNEEFRNKVTEIWDGIVSKFQEFSQGIVERLNEMGFSFTSITDVIKAVWDGFCNYLAPIFEVTFQLIGEILSGAFDVITGLFDIFTGIFTGNWSLVWDGIKEIFNGIWTAITGILSAALDLIYNNFKFIIDSIVLAWETCWNNVKEFCETAWNGIVTFFTESIPNFVESVYTWLNELPGKILSIFSEILTKAVEFSEQMVNKAINMAQSFVSNCIENIKSLPSKIWEFLKQAIDKAGEWVRNMASKGKESINSMLQAITSAAQAIPSKMMSIGKNIVEGVWNGIISAKNWFTSKVKDFFGGIVDGVKSALGIHSPSKVFAAEVGKWIPAGVGMGIEDNADLATKPLNSLFSKVNAGDILSNVNVNSARDASDINLSGVINKLDELINKSGGGIYLDGKTLVGSVINDIDNKLSRIQNQKARGM